MSNGWKLTSEELPPSDTIVLIAFPRNSTDWYYMCGCRREQQTYRADFWYNQSGQGIGGMKGTRWKLIKNPEETTNE